MNILYDPMRATAPVRQHMVLEAVSWQSFEKILDALSEHHLRITYDQGRLELMSPLPIHELWKSQFHRLFDVLVRELRITIKDYGSATFKRPDLAKGVEPDQCFYLSNAKRLRDRRVIDLSKDPPPDLVLEVENTSSCLNRLGIYASLGVSEVWTFDGATLQVYRLIAGGQYEPVAVSPQLPFLPLDEVVPLINQAANAPENWDAIKAMDNWVRQRVAPLYQAAGGKLPPAR